MKNLKFPLIFSLILTILACAPMAPQIQFYPVVNIDPPIQIEDNTKIVLRVNDNRPSDIVGKRPTKNGEFDNVIGSNSLREQVEDELKTELTTAGFHLLTEPELNAVVVTVQINRLNYDLKLKEVNASIKCNGEMMVSVTRDNSTQNRTYKLENSKQWGFSPPKLGHQEYINLTLSEMLEAFLTDTKLLAYMAERD